MGNQTDLPIAKLPSQLKVPFLHGCKNDCLLKNNSYPVRPRGNWNAKVLCLGEAAGLEEETNNCTFIGPAGRLFDDTLMKIGVSLNKNFLLANVCLCRPHLEEESKKQNRKPFFSEVSLCRNNIDKIIELHKPELIVAIGSVSSKSTTHNNLTISSAAGQFLGPHEHNLPLKTDYYAIWHPAYIIRNENKKDEWIKQLVRLRDYMIGRGLLV